MNRPALCALVLCTCTATAVAQVDFAPSITLSVEQAGGANPGEAAAKAKLVRLFKTPNKAHDGRLVVCYADANHTTSIWEPKGGEHAPRDVAQAMHAPGAIAIERPRPEQRGQLARGIPAQQVHLEIALLGVHEAGRARDVEPGLAPDRDDPERVARNGDRRL